MRYSRELKALIKQGEKLERERLSNPVDDKKENRSSSSSSSSSDGTNPSASKTTADKKRDESPAKKQRNPGETSLSYAGIRFLSPLQATSSGSPTPDAETIQPT